MTIRKSDDLANETNSRYDRAKERRANITTRFDDTTHNDNPYDDAIQFLSKKLDDVIDAVNNNSTKTGITTSQANAITANTAKTGISTSQASEITANTAKTGITTTQANAITANTAKVSQGLETDNHTMSFAVSNDGRGNYTLRITVKDTSGREAVTKYVDLSLR